ncbi:MAG: hypothetical protein AB1422_01395 [bacterium]
MYKKQILCVFFIALSLGIMGCEPEKISVSGQIINCYTLKGIEGLDIRRLDIIEKTTQESIINSPVSLTTGNNGNFSLEADVKKILKKIDDYQLKVILPDEFCYPSEFDITSSEIKIKKGFTNKLIISPIKTSYGIVIKGMIKNEKTKDVISGVMVTCKPDYHEESLNKTAVNNNLCTSGRNGNFIFKNLSIDGVGTVTFNLSFDYSNYWKKFKKIDISSLSPEKRVFDLEIELQEIIEGTKTITLSPPINVTILENELNQGILTKNIRETFNRSNYPLSNNAQLNVRKPNKEWTIDDGKFEYIITKQGDKLNCYIKIIGNIPLITP